MDFKFNLPSFDNCVFKCRGVQTYSYVVNDDIGENLGFDVANKVLKFCRYRSSFTSYFSKVFPVKSSDISNFILYLFRYYHYDLFELSSGLKESSDFLKNIALVNGELEIYNLDNLVKFHGNSKDFHFKSCGSVALRTLLQKCGLKNDLFPLANPLKDFCLKEDLNYEAVNSFVSCYNVSKIYYLDIVFMQGNKPVTFSPRLIKSLYFLYNAALASNMLFTMDVSANLLTVTLEERPKITEPEPNDLLYVKCYRTTKSFIYRKGAVPFIHHYKHGSVLGWSAPKEVIFKGDEYLDEQLSTYGLSSSDIPVLDERFKNSYGSRSDYKSWKNRKVRRQWQKHKRSTSQATKGTHYYFGAVPDYDMDALYKEMYGFEFFDSSVDNSVSEVSSDDVSEEIRIKELEQYGTDYWLDLFENS